MLLKGKRKHHSCQRLFAFAKLLNDNPGLLDRNKKLSPNSLQKKAKLSKTSPNALKWLYIYQNINFFAGYQSFRVLLSFALYLTRNRIGFQHFANISK